MRACAARRAKSRTCALAAGPAESRRRACCVLTALSSPRLQTAGVSGRPPECVLRPVTIARPLRTYVINRHPVCTYWPHCLHMVVDPDLPQLAKVRHELRVPGVPLDCFGWVEHSMHAPRGCKYLHFSSRLLEECLALHAAPRLDSAYGHPPMLVWLSVEDGGRA